MIGQIRGWSEVEMSGKVTGNIPINRESLKEVVTRECTEMGKQYQGIGDSAFEVSSFVRGSG